MTNALEAKSIRLSKFNLRVSRDMYNLTCQSKAYFYLNEIPRKKQRAKLDRKRSRVKKTSKLSEYSVRVNLESDRI